jgi:hypothetical protein
MPSGCIANKSDHLGSWRPAGFDSDAPAGFRVVDAFSSVDTAVGFSKMGEVEIDIPNVT